MKRVPEAMSRSLKPRASPQTVRPWGSARDLITGFKNLFKNVADIKPRSSENKICRHQKSRSREASKHTESRKTDNQNTKKGESTKYQKPEIKSEPH